MSLFCSAVLLSVALAIVLWQDVSDFKGYLFSFSRTELLCPLEHQHKRFMAHQHFYLCLESKHGEGGQCYLNFQFIKSTKQLIPHLIWNRDIADLLLKCCLSSEGSFQWV